MVGALRHPVAVATITLNTKVINAYHVDDAGKALCLHWCCILSDC